MLRFRPLPHLTTAILVIALSACASAVADEPSTPSAVRATPTPVPTPQPDTTRPEIEGVTPANGQQAVAVDASITISFSEPVRAPLALLRVQGADGPVAAEVEYDGVERVARITPRQPLASGARYTIVASSAVVDRAGNRLLAQPISFTTAFNVELAAGTHTVFAFADGELGESSEIELSEAVSVNAAQRLVIDEVTYLVGAEAPIDGLVVAEGPRSYRPGIVGRVDLDQTTISFPAGIYAAVSFGADGEVDDSSEVTLTRASNAPAVARQIVDGASYVLIDGGLFDGTWVRADGATASYEREYVAPPPPPAPAPATAAAANNAGTAAPAAPAAPATPAAPAAAPYVQMVWHGTPAYQQQTNIWCVPASVQSMLAMTVGHTGSDQGTIYNFGRSNMGYAINAAGLDPQAWAAALNNFGGLGYADVSYGSFDNAIYAAVMAMRNTGKPVGITINGGTHAWVLVGYSATADPASGSFGINGAYVVAPFMAWADPAPGTFYGTGALRGKMTPYWEAERATRWNGTYVLVQPTW